MTPDPAAPHQPPTASAAAQADFGTLFDFLPIGAYRSTPDGVQLRANPALVRFNGYRDEAEMLASVHDIAVEWYVDPARRCRFRTLLETDGQVTAFVSEVYRHKTRERAWVSENAHVVRDAAGRTLCYEGTVEDVTARVRAAAELQRREERLRAIAEQMPAMMYELRTLPDGQRCYSFVSPGVTSIYGVDVAAVLADGNLLNRMRHPDDDRRIELEVAAALREHRSLSTEFRVVRADGAERWVHLASSPARGEPGAGLRVGVLTDITHVKQAEAALRDSERRWMLALESIGDGVWDWQVQTGVEIVSTGWKRMYGYADDELVERSEVLDAMTHPDDLAQMQRDREAHFDGRSAVYTNEHRMRCKDGSWKWVLSRGMVIERDAEGRPLRMIGIHTDITERKQTEALRLERDRAEAARQAQTQFLSRVSHELRTPLNAILGFSQLIEMTLAADSRQQGWVREVLTSGQHLLGLVDDILELSSAQTGLMPFESVSVDLGEVVGECWSMLAASAEGASVRFVDQLPAGQRVHADRKRLKQIVSNLLSNAIKYNRRGGTVTVASRGVDRGVEFSVADTGLGMDAEQLTRIFNPFERLGAQYGAVEGTGLGMALSKQLAEAMGGAIRVASQPGRGSTFSVWLPDAALAPPSTDART